MYCHKCGKKIDKRSNYCTSCGTDVSGKKNNEVIEEVNEKGFTKNKWFETLFWKKSEKINTSKIGVVQSEDRKEKDELDQEKDKVNDKFFGGTEVGKNDNPERLKIKEDWNSFNLAFWIIFIFHFAVKYALQQQDDVQLGLWSIQFIPVIFMVVTMGYYAFRFTGKRSSVIYGALGFFWFAVIGILGGYIIIRHLRNKAYKNVQI